MDPCLRFPIDLVSEAPWELGCTIDLAGQGLICRIRGGAPHVGAAAFSEWAQGTAVTQCLTVQGQRETEVARHVAHRLCAAARRSVVCISGIGFDGLGSDEIREILEQTDRLSDRAAALLRDARLLSGLDSRGLLGRISHGKAVITELEQFFEQPLERLIEENRGAIEDSKTAHLLRRVQIFAPVYLSNACQNDCVYCGFRHSSRFSRRTLSMDELASETRALRQQGHRIVDLVTGEVTTDAFVRRLAAACRTIRSVEGVEQIWLNVGALSLAQYEELRAAGASECHIYQETYDPSVYFEVHAGGPKRDMAARLEAPHRAALAGFDALGLGILLGLRPVKGDLAALVGHAEVLLQDHPRLRLGFSLPRLRRADEECSYQVAHPIDDETFLKAMIFMRLRFPSAHLTVSSRERDAIRDRLLQLGVSRISAGVRTAPGGYRAGSLASKPQFEIRDRRSYREVSAAIARAGLGS